MNDSELRNCVESVTDPEFGRALGGLGMVKRATMAADGVADVGIELPTPAYPRQERIEEAINAAIQQKSSGAPAAKVSFSWVVKGKETGGKIGLRVKNVIAVGSGTGLDL